LIIDQRFNPGGGIDQELLEILSQRQYQFTKARDSVQITRPRQAFFGPMVVMENERSTSDAEVFPDGFRTLGLGKVVGKTTYGAVIGTGASRRTWMWITHRQISWLAAMLRSKKQSRC